MGEVRGPGADYLGHPAASSPFRRLTHPCPSSGPGGGGPRSNSPPAPGAHRGNVRGVLPHGEGTAQEAALRAATGVPPPGTQCGAGVHRRSRLGRGCPWAARIVGKAGVLDADGRVPSAVGIDRALLLPEAARVSLTAAAAWESGGGPPSRRLPQRRNRGGVSLRARLQPHGALPHANAGRASLSASTSTATYARS